MNTRPDISFANSVLSRHSQKPTTWHWQGFKHLLRYLDGTEDLGLHFRKDASSDIIGYAYFGFKTYPVIGKSQTGYIFIKKRRIDLMALHQTYRDRYVHKLC